jgi:hypothetical protein
MKRQLSLDEQIRIASLMDNYRNIHDNINEVENKLSGLSNEQHMLTDKLETVRNNEKQFGEYLKEKYGPGKLDPVTLEYITE